MTQLRRHSTEAGAPNRVGATSVRYWLEPSTANVDRCGLDGSPTTSPTGPCCSAKHEPVNQPNTAHPHHRHPRRHSKPIPPTHPPVPGALALATRIQHRAHQPARAARTRRLTHIPPSDAPQNPTLRHKPDQHHPTRFNTPQRDRPALTEPPPPPPRFPSPNRWTQAQVNVRLARQRESPSRATDRTNVPTARCRDLPWTNPGTSRDALRS